jgi:hypothetical protein
MTARKHPQASQNPTSKKPNSADDQDRKAPRSDPGKQEKLEPPAPEDPVDESSWESFPASDSPAH